MEVKTFSTIIFFVNGRKVIDSDVDPEWTLLYYLRNKLRLCGTKLGCAEGGCGACTVMLSKYDVKTNSVIHMSANACLAPVCSMHGLSVTTVEGIGSTKTRLHAVQERIAKAHGSQCGFCTPGIVMSMYALLRNKPHPTYFDMETTFQGNLCRCTGYRPIIEGYQTFTEEWERARSFQTSNGVCGLGEKCCKNVAVNGEADEKEELSNEYQISNGKECCKNPTPNGDTNEKEQLFSASDFIAYQPSQELIFPPELTLISSELDAQYLLVKGKRVIWHRPRNLDDLLKLKKMHNDARIVGGNSEIGVEVKFKDCHYPVLIQPSQVAGITMLNVTDSGLLVGAGCTLSNLQNAVRKQIATQPEYKTRLFLAIDKMLHLFAGEQIRNVSAIGGNIMTGSPISDLNPIFMAAGCQLMFSSQDRGVRKVIMDHTFFTGYRTNVAEKDEILLSIFLPYTKKNQFFHAYKQAKRREDDIAIVNAAINATVHPETHKIENIDLAFGGMAATSVLALKTKKTLIGRTWNEAMVEVAYNSLIEDLPLDPSAPGGMIQYRRSLALSFFFKAYLAVCTQLNKPLPHGYQNGETSFHTKPPQSSQYFQVVPAGQPARDLVGRPTPHMSAFKQATGEAVYCDDLPPVADELYLALVLSTRAHARIVSIDARKALADPDVVAFFSAKDLVNKENKFGSVIHDEEIFASEKVVCQGQVIGAIVAKDQLIAQRAAKMVAVEYEDLLPVIITIEDAIREKSFYGASPKYMAKGNVEEALASADHVLSGELRIGGQEHFYLETHCTLVVPKQEDDEMEIFCSTQHPTEIQKLVSEVLDIPMHKIVCRVKRMGGGFGGKESRALLVALPVALAAKRLKRPIRCMLDRNEDMMITGQRHPFKAKYTVGFTKEGKIVACQMELYNNAGCSVDLSPAVMERAMFHFQNAYLVECVKVTGWVCKTNLPSNTAFRGFGAPQAMFFAENMIRHIAVYLQKDVLQVSALNLYREGNLTHYNQTLEYCTLQRCWDECLQRSNFHARKLEIDLFNRQCRWKKRGLSVVPTMFGIAFTAVFLNQTGALVHVYTDGSVLLTHGGTEMGQGLHTKMIQVASRVLEIPASYIHISETSTDKVPNTSPTAASAGSDLNGMAVTAACQTIAKRLKPYRDAKPNGRWEDWVNAAYFDRVSLSATGFYSTPGLGYNWETNSGAPFNYFTFGVACSEVEIDCLTGDHQVIRTDIVMDVGESLNPAIDIGQVEGAFLQGYGLFTLEESVVSPSGILYSRGPGAYKIPGFGDIPNQFNVSLLKGAPNPRAVYSSKAVGEPPLFLAASVFFAIKEAITAARKDVGLDGLFPLDSPATAAKIRMACADKITAKFPEPQEGTYKPWNIAP